MALPESKQVGSTEKGLLEIWENLLQVSLIGTDDEFFDLGGISLQGVEMLMEAERRFGTDLPISILANPVTISGLAALIDGAADQPAAPTSGWGQPGAKDTADTPERPRLSPMLVPLRTEGTRTPLFLVHGVGLPQLGGAFVENLNPGQPAYVFQPRGIDGEGRLSRTIEEMAADYIQAMTEIQPAGPYFLGSVCAGAYIALEMAHQLSERGVSVPMLILFDPPTALHAVRRPWYDPWYAKRLAGFIRRKLIRIVRPGRISLVEGAASRVARRAQIPQFAGADERTQIDRLVDAQTIFVRALRKYRPKPYPGTLHLLCPEGPEDPYRRVEEIWSRMHDDVRLHVIGKKHHSLFSDQLANVARHVQRWLDDFATEKSPDLTRRTGS